MANDDPFNAMSMEQRREGSKRVLQALFPRRLRLAAGANHRRRKPELIRPATRRRLRRIPPA